MTSLVLVSSTRRPIHIRSVNPTMVTIPQSNKHFVNGLLTDQNCVNHTSLTRSLDWLIRSSINLKYNLPGARKNTVFEYTDEFAICEVPLNCAELNNQQNFIFISTRPVEVKEVSYDHVRETFQVEPRGLKHVIFEMRPSGLHFLFKSILYDGIRNSITGEMSPNI